MTGRVSPFAMHADTRLEARRLGLPVLSIEDRWWAAHGIDIEVRQHMGAAVRTELLRTVEADASDWVAWGALVSLGRFEAAWERHQHHVSEWHLSAFEAEAHYAAWVLHNCQHEPALPDFVKLLPAHGVRAAAIRQGLLTIAANRALNDDARVAAIDKLFFASDDDVELWSTLARIAKDPVDPVRVAAIDVLACEAGINIVAREALLDILQDREDPARDHAVDRLKWQAGHHDVLATLVAISGDHDDPARPVAAAALHFAVERGVL